MKKVHPKRTLNSPLMKKRKNFVATISELHHYPIFLRYMDEIMNEKVRLRIKNEYPGVDERILMKKRRILIKDPVFIILC